MKPVRLVRSADLAHAEYVDAAIVPANAEMVFLAGACPLNRNGTVVSPGDVAAQTRQALANMDAALLGAQCDLENVAFLRVLVASSERDDLAAAWAAVREHLGDRQVPATLQGVTTLGYPSQLVEIEPVAARFAR